MPDFPEMGWPSFNIGWRLQMHSSLQSLGIAVPWEVIYNGVLPCYQTCRSAHPQFEVRRCLNPSLLLNCLKLNSSTSKASDGKADTVASYSSIKDDEHECEYHNYPSSEVTESIKSESNQNLTRSLS